MPNWTENTLTIRGPTEVIKTLLEAHIVDGALDFDTIVPKPEGFDETLQKGPGEESYDLYYDPSGDVVRGYLAHSWVIEAAVSTLEELHAFMSLRYAESAPQVDSELFMKYSSYKALADAYARNMELTGCKTWYEWNMNHWGTKWNACDTSVVRWAGDYEATLYFNTAWVAPTPVIEALAERYPALYIEIVSRYEGEAAIDGQSFNHGYEDHFLQPEEH